MNEVGQLGLASLGPVLHVMGIHVARVRATGKSTAAITCIERAAQRRRDAARLAPDIERLPLRVLEDADNAGVACQTARGLHG